MIEEVDAKPDAELDAEYLIIGAGVCGLYQLYRLARDGRSVIVLDANDGVGGTWYMNRYPGCRFDSESYTYGYSFSPEMLDWSWSERFSSQPETLRYFTRFAELFDLERYIHTGSRVTAATFDEQTNTWLVDTAAGRQYRARFIITALGLLSTPTSPRYEGIESFNGPAFHTYYWPHEGVELKNKRVAVIGTGSTGVQVISTIAADVAQLTVYQRSPNWCVPLGNGPISPAEMDQIKKSYDEVFEKCMSPSGFMYSPDPRKTFEVPEEERLALWEKLYEQPGFGLWLGNFKDTMTDAAANAALSAFVADKIRSRVTDPVTAEKLVPKSHGFGTRRVPLETRYYETYNRPNVRLIDLSETPITRIRPTGIETTDDFSEFDVIIFATGFDAITGAFDHIEFRGRGGRSLKDKWSDGPKTHLGLATNGFPNLLMLLGPQQGSAATNFPRGIEAIVDWVTPLLTYMAEHDITVIEADAAAEEAWVEHVAERLARTLMGQTRSWFTGHNVNLDRPDIPRVLIYTGGLIRFRQRLVEEADEGYPGFTLTAGEQAPNLIMEAR